MHKLLFLLLLLPVYLFSSAKLIVIESADTKEEAIASYKSIKNILPITYQYAKNKKLKFKVKKVKDKYALITLGFTSESVFEESLDETQEMFLNSYTSTYKSKKTLSKEPEEKSEIEKQLAGIVDFEKIKSALGGTWESVQELFASLKNTLGTGVNSLVSSVSDMESPTASLDSVSAYLNWMYVLYFIIGAVILRYFIKFKKIYDQY